ncbi:MAG: hypothetical protein KAT09_04890 [Candidatus Aegiribacteria sp.]|nr:hypothetical protein [Candidatus Aegiribacteria sp.]
MLRDLRVLLTILPIVLLCGAAWSTPPLDDFIYPDEEIIESIIQINDERLDEALFTALESLTEMGVANIIICRFQRIEAPLGGYLIDGLFNLKIKGKNYSTFRIGIEDGEPDTFFTFMARGIDHNSNAIWYPLPGPDYMPEENQVTPESFFTYEFLIDRDEFENLENEFPRLESVDSEE